MENSVLRAWRVTRLVLYLICGHHGNQWGLPLVMKSSTGAYGAIPSPAVESGLRAFLVRTSFLVQSLAHSRHHTDIQLKTLICYQGIRERNGPVPRCIHCCRRQLPSSEHSDDRPTFLPTPEVSFLTYKGGKESCFPI